MTAPKAPESTEALQKLADTLIGLHTAEMHFYAVAARNAAISENDMAALLLVGDRLTTPGELGRQLSLSTGAITALIDRLEDSGHVTRPNDPSDRRKTRLVLTADGERTRREVRAAYIALLTEAVSPGPAVIVQEQIDRFRLALGNVEAR